MARCFAGKLDQWSVTIDTHYWFGQMSVRCFHGLGLHRKRRIRAPEKWIAEPFRSETIFLHIIGMRMELMNRKLLRSPQKTLGCIGNIEILQNQFQQHYRVFDDRFIWQCFHFTGTRARYPSEENVRLVVDCMKTSDILQPASLFVFSNRFQLFGLPDRNAACPVHWPKWLFKF